MSIENTRAVKQAAIEAGFDVVGIARAEPLTKPMERYRDWLEGGNHGMLSWLEKRLDEREDVSQIVPGARSVVVVGRNYYTPHEHAKDAVGKISRYAWGDDYHDVVPKMLDDLSERIERIVLV